MYQRPKLEQPISSACQAKDRLSLRRFASYHVTVAEIETLISDEMRAVVGKVMTTMTSYPISASDIRRWASAVYYPEVPPKLYWDEDYASKTPFGGIVAPEEFNPFAIMTKDPRPTKRVMRRTDFELILGIQPPPTRAILQSEVRVHYSGVRMCPGDIIRSIERIGEYSEREGKMGLQLYTTVSNEYINQRDEQVKVLQTMFVRY